MVYVKRDSENAIVAVSRDAQAGFLEEASEGNAELQQYLASLGPDSALARTDLEFIRVLEDVLELLMAKGVMLFTELPEEAQAKILERQSLRRRGEGLDLLDGDSPL